MDPFIRDLFRGFEGLDDLVGFLGEDFLQTDFSADESIAYALTKKLTDRRNISTLTTAVTDHVPEVERLNRDELYRAHAHAAVYTGQLELASSSFERIVPSDRELAVIGLIAYDAGNYETAESNLRLVQTKIAQVRMALSSIMIHNGQTNRREQAHLLGPVSSSPSARCYLNSFLGVDAFNHGDYHTAELYLQKVLEIKDMPEAQLQVMQAKFKQGKKKEVWKMAGKYLHDTGLSDSEILTAKLNLDQLEFPSYQVNKQTLHLILG